MQQWWLSLIALIYDPHNTMNHSWAFDVIVTIYNVVYALHPLYLLYLSTCTLYIRIYIFDSSAWAKHCIAHHSLPQLKTHIPSKPHHITSHHDIQIEDSTIITIMDIITDCQSLIISSVQNIVNRLWYLHCNCILNLFYLHHYPLFSQFKDHNSES